MAVTFQFGTICYYGQRVTSQSEELLNASYNCEWYNQSKRFKSTLIVLRYVCQRDLALGVGKTRFSLGTFYEVTKVRAYFNILKILISQRAQFSYDHYQKFKSTVHATHK